MSWFDDNGYVVYTDPSATPDRQLTNEIDPNDPYAGSDSYYNGGSYSQPNADGSNPAPTASSAPPPNNPFGPNYQWSGSQWVYAPNPGPGYTWSGSQWVATDANSPTSSAPAAPASASGNATDPIGFIRQWQMAHPQASPQAFQQLATDLQNQFGITRWDTGGGVLSNNEFNINGQKIKAYNEGGNSWYDPGGLSDDGGGSAYGNLSTLTQPFTAPAPFSYPDFTAPAPFSPPSPDDVANDPAHQFRLKEGLAAVDRGAAANGTLNTGATPKAETAYAQGLATQDYNDLFNKDYQTYGLNYSNLADVYNTNRNNAASNYLTNFNVATGTWDRNRQAGLDTYGMSQDQINNLFKLAGYGQAYTGVPAPYVASA